MATSSDDHPKTGDTAKFPYSAFFYGTLMAPQVLHRVCHNSMEPDNPIFATHQFKSYPAILHDFRRHRVRDADYPAILPSKGASVRGTFVSGLTENDIRRLDLFEGQEYRRDIVKAHILTKVGDEDGKGNIEGEQVECETYVWQAGSKYLDDASWDFAEFQREKLSYWASIDGASEYKEVDELFGDAKTQDGTGGRGANGNITKALKEEHERGEAAS